MSILVNRDINMRSSILALLLCCGLIISCNSVEIRFPIEETLAQDLFPLQGITDPVRVEVKSPFLIVQNWKRSDSLFHIYDLNTCELKSAFGVEGRGPDEFLVPWMFHTKFPDIFIGDISVNRVRRFGISSDGLPVLKEVKHSNFIQEINEAAFINDSLFVLDPRYLAPSIYLLSFEDDLPRKTFQFRNPDILDYYADPDMATVYANDSRIVLCYGWKKQIDFLDTELNLLKRVTFKYDGAPDVINSDNEEDVKSSYVSSYLGRRYLYALFMGVSWREHRGINSYRGTFLEVFDLDGNPVARYRLDGVRPIHFSVDEDTFTLYGSGREALEDHLVVYRLKGLL